MSSTIQLPDKPSELMKFLCPFCGSAPYTATAFPAPLVKCSNANVCPASEVWFTILEWQTRTEGTELRFKLKRLENQNKQLHAMVRNLTPNKVRAKV